MLKVDITKRYRNFTLRVDFEAKAHTVGLLGASGSGKSLTLKCIAGIERPDEGIIELDNAVLFNSKKRIDMKMTKRGVGLMFQHYALFPNMTVRQNILAGARPNLSTKERELRLGELIKMLKLSGLENNKPFQLSGGQSQRVALARILINEPRALLLDEPFSALDSYSKWRLEQELCDILRDFCAPVLYVSHDRDEIFRFCDNVIALENGVSEPQTPVREFFSAPATFAAALISGCKNFSRANKSGAHTISAVDWGAELITAEEVHEPIRFIGVRAHYISIVGCEEQNCIRARVVRIANNLFSRVITLDTEREVEDEFRYLRVETPLLVNAPEHGERVFVKLPPEAIMPLR